jgi:hypothetical protein
MRATLALTAELGLRAAGLPDFEERVFRPALQRLFASLVMVDHSPTQMGAP